MCRNIKTKLLSIITLVVFVCIAGLCVGCSKKNKVGLTASELNIEGKTPISYSEFVNDSGADIKDDDIGYKMEKGAVLVMITITTFCLRWMKNPGI